jgi:hypothetical protein
MSLKFAARGIARKDFNMMILQNILKAVFEDGKKFHNLGSTSHIPDAPEIEADLQAADTIISAHLTIDQDKWQGDFSRYPAEVWARLKRDAFAAGVQGRDSYNQAGDFFRQEAVIFFDNDVEYIKEWLNKSIVLQPIHLGKGEQAIMRRLALDALAGEAGYWWNGQPSVGRWLISLADEKINTAA